MKIKFSLLCLLILFSLSNAVWSAENAFRQALVTNNLSDISKLVAITEDIDQRGTNGKTALMIAAKAGDAAVFH